MFFPQRFSRPVRVCFVFALPIVFGKTSSSAISAHESEKMFEIGASGDFTDTSAHASERRHAPPQMGAGYARESIGRHTNLRAAASAFSTEELDLSPVPLRKRRRRGALLRTEKPIEEDDLLSLPVESFLQEGVSPSTISSETYERQSVDHQGAEEAGVPGDQVGEPSRQKSQTSASLIEHERGSSMVSLDVQHLITQDIQHQIKEDSERQDRQEQDEIARQVSQFEAVDPFDELENFSLMENLSKGQQYIELQHDVGEEFGSIPPRLEKQPFPPTLSFGDGESVYSVASKSSEETTSMGATSSILQMKSLGIFDEPSGSVMASEFSLPIEFDVPDNLSNQDQKVLRRLVRKKFKAVMCKVIYKRLKALQEAGELEYLHVAKSKQPRLIEQSLKKCTKGDDVIEYVRSKDGDS